MPASPGSKKNEQPSTYFVQNREKKLELARLTVQGRMLTTAMGGPLPEQTESGAFKDVLDVACGPGDWVIDIASTYPDMTLTGLDISQLMINYAELQATAAQLDGRVSFRVMDALENLHFPKASFDLVNLRLGASFLRTWDWPKLLNQMLRVTRPGGTVRLTDSGHMESSGAAVTLFFDMLKGALFRSGHLFTMETSSLTAHLPRLLIHHGCHDVQSRAYDLEFRACTPAGESYYDNLLHLQTIRPFVQKWGLHNEDFDTVHRLALEEAQQSSFWAVWHFLSAWGIKS